MTTVVLRLYVAGDTPRSRRARRNLESLCTRVRGPTRCDVIDVMRDPAEAEAARVLLTPTLVAELGDRRRRVIGDLSDLSRVLDALGLASDDDRDDHDAHGTAMLHLS